MAKKAVILCGGLGSRIKSFRAAIPRPLLPIGERAILEIQIEHLVRDGFEEVILATNAKSAYLERLIGNGSQYGARVIVSKEDEPLGTAGPLGLLREELSEEPFLVMNGDILTLMDFGEFYDYAVDRGDSMTAAVRRVVTPFAFGDIRFEGDYVTSIVEKPDIVTHALAGVYVMTPAVLEYIPVRGAYGLDELIRAMLAVGDPVGSYLVEDYCLDIGEAEDFDKAQEDYLSHVEEAR